MAAGDRVTLLWSGDVTGPYTDYIPVAAATVGHYLTFEVGSEQIATNHEVAISYEVEPADGGATQSSYPLALQIGDPVLLPAPVVDGVTGTTIDPADYPDGVTVTVPAEAALAAGDQVTLYWTGTDESGTTSPEETVTGNGAGKPLHFTIPASVLTADEGTTVQIYYTVTRASSGITETSAVAVYDISGEGPAPSGTLKIMGARSALYGVNSHVRTLTALNAETLALTEATWQYEGDTAPRAAAASRFRDTHPDRQLHVSTANDRVILNVSNISGNEYAMTAICDNGNVVTWGDDYGGTVPAAIATLTDIVAVTGSTAAFAARRSNGKVVAWGSPSSGGAVPLTIATLTDIVAVAGSDSAFAARRSNGKVVAWGNPASGGAVPSTIASLTDIVSVQGAEAAFAALRSNGKVVAWGNTASGGAVPSTIASLTDIVEITPGNTTFAALRGNGSVVAWGETTSGGKVPDTIASLTDIVSVYANAYAFAALRSNGKVVAWGNIAYGGKVPDTIAILNDIVSVAAHYAGFAALRSNGHVVGWGADGNVPSTIATLDDIVQVTATGKNSIGYGAFSVLRSNGAVEAWGNAFFGGTISDDVQAQLTDVRGVYAADKAFAALCGDSRVVTWGSGKAGGDSSHVQALLTGNISYEATPSSRGVGIIPVRTR